MSCAVTIRAGDSGACGQPGGAIEVDRTVNATGLIGLAGRQHPIGVQYAGQRVTVRIDRGVLQLVDDGVLLRSMPSPLTPAEIARLRDARPPAYHPARPIHSSASSGGSVHEER